MQSKVSALRGKGHHHRALDGGAFTMKVLARAGKGTKAEPTSHAAAERKEKKASRSTHSTATRSRKGARHRRKGRPRCSVSLSLSQKQDKAPAGERARRGAGPMVSAAGGQTHLAGQDTPPRRGPRDPPRQGMHAAGAREDLATTHRGRRHEERRATARCARRGSRAAARGSGSATTGAPRRERDARSLLSRDRRGERRCVWGGGGMELGFLPQPARPFCSHRNARATVRSHPTAPMKPYLPREAGAGLKAEALEARILPQSHWASSKARLPLIISQSQSQ